MVSNEQLSTDDPRYEARLRAQYGVVLGIGLLPLGIILGILVAYPLAQMTSGFPLAIFPTGVSSVLVLLGAGLYLLALTQDLLLVVEGFWNLRHSVKEISGAQRVTWNIGRVGVLLLGIGFGFGLGFLVV